MKQYLLTLISCRAFQNNLGWFGVDETQPEYSLYTTEKAITTPEFLELARNIREKNKKWLISMTEVHNDL